MIKVQILTKCDDCNGEAYLPIGEVEDYKGRKYTRYVPCSNCEGSGKACKWISLEEFAILLRQALCTHENAMLQGSHHFSAGDVWDDIVEVCDDCGAHLG